MSAPALRRRLDGGGSIDTIDVRDESMPRMPTAASVMIFPDVELLDFAGPLEVLTTAHDAGREPLFEVSVIAPAHGPFRTRHGLTIAPDHTLADAPGAALLVVPGGFGVRALLDDDATIAFLRRSAEAGTIVASVCTGAWLLARAGLLADRAATTHHLCLDRLRELSPSTVVVPDRRIVDEGPVVTSGGVAAGIDMALHMVERLHGRDASARTARYIEYPWPPAATSTRGGG